MFLDPLMEPYPVDVGELKLPPGELRRPGDVPLPPGEMVLAGEAVRPPGELVRPTGLPTRAPGLIEFCKSASKASGMKETMMLSNVRGKQVSQYS